MAEELGAPLSRRKSRGKAAPAPATFGQRPSVPWARLGLLLLFVVGVGLAVRIVLIDDPTGGRPSAEARISPTVNPIAEDLSLPNSTAADLLPEAQPAPGGPSITTVDASIPDATGAESATAEADQFGVLPGLSEETDQGPIPRIGPDGQTPFAAYARASLTPETAGGKPLIAIVVTGLGLNQSGTLQAIADLPAEVTLAFAPYGKTLSRTVAEARAHGRELLLQVPLEPFDYPDNDPGPETLLTGEPARANLDRLFWLMARFGGYVGVINHMGARFTASGSDFTPIMEELGTRGLGYLDDGGSNRSLAPQLARSNKVPFSRADFELDTNPARAPILSALAALEAKAAEKGSAIGIISALPVSISTVAEWARGLEDKGIVLVPASALMK